MRWLLLWWSTGSRHVGFSSCGSQALECRLSSCGIRAGLLRSMWDPPGPGIKPVSPALADQGSPLNPSFECCLCSGLSFFFPSGTAVRNMSDLVTSVASVFSTFLPSHTSFWFVSSEQLSCSLIHSPAMSNLLLNPSVQFII